MDLKNFISETTKQIADRVIEGNEYVKKESNSKESVRNWYTTIQFDIAVTTNKENKKDLSGEISVIEIFNAGTASS